VPQGRADPGLTAQEIMMEQTELKDRIVVITGASSGFGKGAALAFSRAGASLVLAARRSELIDELAEECERANGRALAVPTDVSRWEEMEELARAAIDVFGRIDVWVNNAGVGAIGPFQRIPVREHRQVIETNLIGTLYGSYLAYREFLARGRGVLINIASELGRHTVPYYASYVAAKHGVVGLGESLQQEIEQQNLHDIHVCTVLPHCPRHAVLRPRVESYGARGAAPQAVARSDEGRQPDRGPRGRPARRHGHRL
jgi:NAD(P)-dependent dehydrogenase (short-subunit alcohol dehydrogenase family)